MECYFQPFNRFVKPHVGFSGFVDRVADVEDVSEFENHPSVIVGVA